MHRSKQLFIALTLGLGLTVALLTLLALPARAIGFTVTKFTDTNDGVCDADCSLREAIITTNAITGLGNTITLGAGTYTLSIGGSGEDSAATGDLDISVSNVLTITGLGADQTVIDAAGIDRVFHILAGTVVISGVTIQNGGDGFGNGGGILNQGSLTLQNSVVADSSASYGGGIYNDTSGGNLAIDLSNIYSNTSGIGGGGIYNNDGTLVIDQSNIYRNVSNCSSCSGGGGIYNTSNNSVTVTHSSIYSNFAKYEGGGFLNIGSLSLTHSSVFNNSSDDAAGGIYNSGDLNVNLSDIYSNTATFSSSGLENSFGNAIINQSNIYSNAGRGISNHRGIMTVTNSSIYGNQGGGINNSGFSNDVRLAIIQSSIYNHHTNSVGGGIHSDDGFLTIDQSSIYSNSAGVSGSYDGFVSGGGIYNGFDGILTIIESSLYNNTAYNGNGNGGGIVSLGSLTVTQSSLYNNSASGSGGGIYKRGSATLAQSSIYSNSATNTGGGLYNYNGKVSISNSTFSGNQGTSGGGIHGFYSFFSGGEVNLLNSTLALNQGGGLKIDSTISATLQNTLLVNNGSNNCSGSITSLGHNLSSDDSCTLTASGDITNTDPLLEPLANNGGPTVGVDNEPLLTHAMPADSPAVDAANVAACPATDQLGNLRPYGPGCDIGALEVTPKAVLYIRKSAPITVASGGQVDYVITVTNRGNLTATNVNITDTVPANTNYVSGGAPVGGDVTWSVGDLGPKAVTVQSFAVTTTQAAINIDYIASADGGVTASRNEAIVTIVRQFGVGTSVFVPVQSLGNPPLNSRAVAVGDLNTDGYPDAFVANGSPNTVYLNDGTGRLSDSGQNLADNDSQAVALGDLDDDGDLDAFVGNDGSQGNQIWLNDGDGNFVTTGAPSLGSADSQAVALDDLNGDGLLDVMLGTDAGDGNQIWLNNGEGSLALTETLTVGDSQALALVDFNDDGFPDAVSANNGEDNQIWLNDGDGTFSAGPVLVGTENSQAVVIGDIDNNGHPDVIIGNSGSVANHVWLNQGGGSFNANPIALGNRDTRGLALGDLDLDGDLDLLVANGSDQPNEIWLNDGSGDFGDEPAFLFDSSDSNAIALADFDLDGDLDIFVGNGDSGDGQGNTVWLNQDAQQGGVTNNSGGTLVFGGELTLTVNIPAGSLPAQGASFTYTPLLGPTPDFSNTLQYDNRAFELGADTDVTFDPPLTLTVYYPPETEITTDTLRLYYRDTDENPAMWKDVATTCVPTSTYHYEADFVAVAICHLTEFALFDLLSGGSDVFLPVVIK